MRSSRVLGALGLALAAAIAGQDWLAAQTTPQDGPAQFRSGVEVVNLTATVVDANGRFVPGLRQEDFIVYENEAPQAVTHFSAERVPVSLGIAVDTSNSMAGEKIEAARLALRHFFDDLLEPDDDIFMYRFSDQPVLLQGWTIDRMLLSRALRRLTPDGGTAMYDAVAAALPMTRGGRHDKKAIMVISDGNDTSSHVKLGDLKRQIQESQALVYAIGIDREGLPTARPQAPPRQPGFPFPTPGTGPTRRPPGRLPFPFPGPRRRPGQYLSSLAFDAPQLRGDDRVNERALRDLTDGSGGRTEIVRDASDLNPATAAIADELSRQYALAYPAGGIRDGQWHAIRVEIRGRREYVVRTRNGYFAN